MTFPSWKNKKLKTLGLVLGILASLTAITIAFASPTNKFGKAKTPPFPEPAEKDLQKIIFIRYAPGYGRAKEGVCDNDGLCEPRENWKNCPNDCPKGEEPTPTLTPSNTCYGFLSGARPKWNWVEDYYYSDASLAGPSAQAVLTWEEPVLEDIFGQGHLDNFQWGVYDGHNFATYDDWSEEGVLAVTAIWFRGKRIYEYDIMFDTDYFPGKQFDLETVTLHEFGHGAGLDDLYDLECAGEVMYGYLEPGEIRTILGPGDTLGIRNLYGE